MESKTETGTDIILATINAKWIHPSLALRLLKANLGSLQSRCVILEFALRQNETEKITPILAARPKILGLSVSIWNHKATLDLLKSLFARWNEDDRPWVVLGGPEVSWLERDTEIFLYADYVIRGEAEFAFRALCEKLMDSIPGKEPLIKPPHDKAPHGKAVVQFIEADLPDLSSLASPYDLYTSDDLGQRLIYAESSRGCAFKCDFCLSSLDKSVREFPLDIFLSDMEKLLKRASSLRSGEADHMSLFHFKTIKFLDRSFNLSPERAVKILEFFLDRINDGFTNFCVHFEMVPCNFTLELQNILRLFPSGSLRIELGIQTLNPQTAAHINRAGNADEALKVLAFLREETNAIVHADLIAGLPGEDMVSFGNGFDRLWAAMTGLAHNAGLNSRGTESLEIQPGILKLLPGTPMARHTNPFGMKYAAEAPYELIENTAIPSAEMERLKNFARFWELLVNRNHFSKEISRIIHPGEPVFHRFMELADNLLGRFGRNWGIDREDIRQALTALG